MFWSDIRSYTRTKEAIRSYPDFPKPGVTFRDISPLLRDVEHWNFVLRRCREAVADFPDTQYVIGMDARGFLLAGNLGYPAVMARKKGKLPGQLYEQSYELEYGTDTITIQKDALPENCPVVIVDDLLATGGTLCAAIDLVKQAGARIQGVVTIIELEHLGGRKRLIEKGLTEYEVFSLFQFQD